jgi:isopentenyl-diphosphate delta-isomerase
VYVNREGVELAEETRRRKADHIKIALNQNVQARQVTTGLEDVCLVHKALPEIDKKKVDLSTMVFGHKFAAPLIVGAITGGTEEALKINSRIAETVEELGLGMGVGSQRAAIENKRLEKTFTIARKKAPTAFLIANIGGIQLVNGYGLKDVKKAIEMIEADAIAIHLNALQEAVQPEGQTNFTGVLEKIREITSEIDTPVIAKETGAGISAEEAREFEDAGVKAIDVGGAGGTSFAAVEYYRARAQENSVQHNLGNTFWDWGIPTAASIVEASVTTKICIIGSGGIRNGIDVAKALTLGASLTSSAYSVLKAANKNMSETRAALSLLIDELRNTMFLVGANSVDELKKTHAVIMGRTAEWLNARGFNVSAKAQRRMD